MAWTNLSFAYGSALTSTKMTQLQANFAAMAAGDSGSPTIVNATNLTGSGTVSNTATGGALLTSVGRLVAFTAITATNATWSPNAATTRMVIFEVGAGSGGGQGTLGAGYYGYGGKKGTTAWGVCNSVSGTYAATIGVGGAGGTSAGDGSVGGTTSFIGTGISLSAVGGHAWGFTNNAPYTANKYYRRDATGEDGLGYGGTYGEDTTGGAAAANTGAGGGAHAWVSAGGAFNGGAGGSGVIYVWEYA